MYSLAFSIKDVLLQMNLALYICRGQRYDGVSNMSGTKNGVALLACSQFGNCSHHEAVPVMPLIWILKSPN